MKAQLFSTVVLPTFVKLVFFKDLHFSQGLTEDLMMMYGIDVVQSSGDIILKRTLLLKNEQL